jgi:hypothetical protein
MDRVILFCLGFIFGVLQISPLKNKSRPEISESKLGSKEIRIFGFDVVFSFPGGFLFCVVAPLDFQELDASSSGSAV